MDGTISNLGSSKNPKKPKIKVNEPKSTTISGLHIGNPSVDPDLLEAKTKPYEIGFDSPTSLAVPLDELEADIKAQEADTKAKIAKTIAVEDTPTMVSPVDASTLDPENTPTKVSPGNELEQPLSSPASKLDLLNEKEQEALEETKVERLGQKSLNPEIPSAEPTIEIMSPKGNISETPEIMVFHLPLAIEPEEGDLTFEELLQMPKLRDGEDPYMLYRLFNQYIDDERLQKFLERAARNPWDATLFWKNRHADFMTPEVIHSMLIVGSKVDYYVDKITKQKSRLFIYTTPEFNRGALCTIAPAYYAFEDDTNLRTALIKKTTKIDPEFPGNLSEEEQDKVLKKVMSDRKTFEDEKNTAEDIKSIIDANLHDERIRNVLYPIHIGVDYILMSHKMNAEGESLNLKDVLKRAGEGGANKVLQETARALIGTVKGLELLTEHNYINLDLKPQNIVDTEYSGCLIDWGGFTKYDRLKESGASLQLNLTYCNLAIAQMEAMGYLGKGAAHKFMLARIIERVFYLLQGWRSESMSLNPNSLPARESMRLDPEQLKTSGNELLSLSYDLYRKLFNSYQHSYVFKNNDRSQGPDPEFISTGRIIDELEQIANYKPKQND
ncbi:hypothetical protein IT411_00465 [Candidatus Peregrinibacteria bacterium]|nr:hypothetical protein [Candidatus Peregrinibacteria bacterium]